MSAFGSEEDNYAAMDTWRQYVQLDLSQFAANNGWAESSAGEESEPGEQQQGLQSPLIGDA